MAYMRKLGYTAEKVEQPWNPWSKVRKDFAGFADLIVFGRGEIVAVQTTSYSNMRAREKKIMAEPRAHEWILAGGHIVLHGWKPVKGPSKKIRKYELVEKILMP